MVYFIQVKVTACEQDQDRSPSLSCSQAVSKPAWHISLLCVQWKTPDDGQRNCPKHVKFYSKNKFWEISASSWFYFKNLSRCTVTWTSSFDLNFVHYNYLMDLEVFDSNFCLFVLLSARIYNCHSLFECSNNVSGTHPSLYSIHAVCYIPTSKVARDYRWPLTFI